MADDFSNFRTTVTAMLTKLGIGKVDVASNGTSVIQTCQRASFDLILCDYDLGVGKNGQQVLEELRHNSIIGPKTVFIVVSADASKDVVMAAYDCEPDDYLMKPITAKMLHQRMARLLTQRKALMPVYKALEGDDSDKAVHLLIDLSLSEGRQALCAQKLLGELFVARSELSKAEKLYTKALELRQVDWARLGLARVKRLKGDHEGAGQVLGQLVGDNPLYLPAYDELANNLEAKGETLSLQKAVQQTVSISPKSILRQKRLAEVAERNGDYNTAVEALRSTVRLGDLSCLASAEDNLNFARVAATSVEKNIAPANPLTREAIDVLDKARHRFSMSQDQLARAALLEGRAHVLAGNRAEGEALIASAEEAVLNGDESVDAAIERIKALQTLGELEQAEALIAHMLEQYAYDQAVLQRLDWLLEEPVSDSNRSLVANINREGIDLYNAGQYDQAMDCFEKARRLFPKHIGIQLNIVQALIGKLKQGDTTEDTVAHTQHALQEVSNLVNEEHPHYNRFVRLQDMASASIQNCRT